MAVRGLLVWSVILGLGDAYTTVYDLSTDELKACFSNNTDPSEESSEARTIFVDSFWGCNTWSGNKTHPVRSVAECVDRMKLSPPDSTCALRAGLYKMQTYELNNLHGGEGAPYTIRGYGVETVIIDGTIDIGGSDFPWYFDENAGTSGAWRLNLDDVNVTDHNYFALGEDLDAVDVTASIKDILSVILHRSELYHLARWPNA
ncbi:hypothetical protein CYMTET_32193, partial [Cymbomonas tetramitiformis]